MLRAEIERAGAAMLYAPNFSVGVAIFERVVAEAARLFAGTGFDGHLIETHHAAKKDAPSGTAAALARTAETASGTPATVLLAKEQIAFTLHPYEHDPRAEAYGDEAAAALGIEPERIFKTLIASVDGALTCAVVPVAGMLNLKALAAAAGGKKAGMAKVADAERSSGYVAGGISPLGQRKALRTVVDASASSYPTIMVSAGKRGLQVELAPADLIAQCRATVADIAVS